MHISPLWATSLRKNSLNRCSSVSSLTGLGTASCGCASGAAKSCPLGEADHKGSVPQINALKAAVAGARGLGPAEMVRDALADQLWESEYGELTTDVPGRFGAVTSRGRGPSVAALYALTCSSTSSCVIKRVHLEAAAAMWEILCGFRAPLVFYTCDNPDTPRLFWRRYIKSRRE